MESDTAKWDKYRNLAGFWILGLTNNFAYVVMLSAAHDILRDESHGNSTDNSTTEAPPTGNHSHPLIPDCNKIGTGAILLADILPTLIVKFTAPFYMHLIPYSVKVLAVVIFGTASFPVVALSHATWLSLLGVVFASIGAGFGEITFLSLSSHFPKNVVSSWSSGTGAAGVFGALSYAGLTALGVSPRTTLLIMLVIPAAMALSYYFLLVKPSSVYSGIQNKLLDEQSPILEHADESDSDGASDLKGVEDFSLPPEQGEASAKNKFLERLSLIVPLLKYMVPLGLVYLAEYFINQALFELIIFQHIWLPDQQQYRWYQVIYQIGVFISRSSVNLFQVTKLWILPVLQFVNVAVLVCQILFGFLPSIWLIFVIVIWEGLLGGCAYVNTFYKISQEVAETNREFSMGVASVADSAGITIAAIISVPVHNLFCDLNR